MYDRAVGAQRKANAAVDSITDVMMQIPDLEKTVDGLAGSGVGPEVTLDGVTDKVEDVKQLVPQVNALMQRLTQRMQV